MRVKELWVLSLVLVVCLGGFMVPKAHAQGEPLNVWLFEEGIGVVAECWPEIDNYGDLMLGAGWSTDTPTGWSTSCLSLDGVDDYVWTPLVCLDPADSPAEGWRSVSVEAWIKIDAFAASTTQMIVEDDWINAFSLHIATNASLESSLWGFVTRFPVSADTPILPGVWYHIALTCDRYGPAPNLRIYVNGELDGTGVAGGPAFGDAYPVHIGASAWNQLHTVNGLIDDVMVRRGALSGARIRHNYENGLMAPVVPEDVPIDSLNLGAEIEWTSEYGYKYQVEWSPDDATWEERGPVMFGTGDVMRWEDTTTTSFHEPGQSYYRVLQLTNYY